MDDWTMSQTGLTSCDSSDSRAAHELNSLYHYGFLHTNSLLRPTPFTILDISSIQRR